ncbi:hypothetical protein [Chitinophaga varians]|uniref:hypothetical protein n=1 Tax=Chitinophaga varians TaxID=2202339 RepID=UPI0016600385|nr:hypothetical protein [Chitinophaga varians]MBC9915553.1 hypothetical protein [Chitinophaga varians]
MQKRVKFTESIKVVYLTLGALIGFGGAYATSHKADPGAVSYTYNWYTPNGNLAFISTVAVARSACPIGGVVVCLQGTNTARQLQPITLFRASF